MILIVGSSGQVGAALMRRLGGQAVGLDRAQLDLASPDALRAALKQHKPSVILNAAAYTQVDKAESEPELAHAVNAAAPAIIAEYCAAHAIPLVHFSTDYVFDGSGSTPWTEDDATSPLSVYGATKRAGEEAIVASGCAYLIFRTSWVYAETGRNFLTTILHLAREREELKIVSDQMGAPTYAGQLAEAVLQALSNAQTTEHFPNGIYHLTHSGITSWHGFATAIVEEARAHETLQVKRILPIPSAEYPTPATRPLFSALNCTKAKRILGVALPAWQEGLRACMTNVYET